MPRRATRYGPWVLGALAAMVALGPGDRASDGASHALAPASALGAVPTAPVVPSTATTAAATAAVVTATTTTTTTTTAITSTTTAIITSTTTPATTALPDPQPVQTTLGSRPATLDHLPLAVATAPTRLRVPALEIDVAVAPVSADPSGEVAVPPTVDVVAWYEHGPVPGDAGSAVLAGHVDWDGAPGPFFRLHELAPGEAVTVVLADGREIEFQIVAVERVAKAALPRDRLFARDGPPGLALVTCGGDFDRSARTYLDNVIAWAVPT